MLAAATTVGAATSGTASHNLAGSTTTTGLVVSVAYAENVGDIGGVNAWFPTPWCTLVTTTGTACSGGADPSKVSMVGQPDPNGPECAPTSKNPNLTKPYCWDEGAVRLDNPVGNAPVTLSGIAVNVRCNTSSGMLFYGGTISPTGFGCGSGRTRQLWAGSACSGCFFPLTIAPGKSVILTGNPPPPAHQDSFVDFDSSDTPHNLCTPATVAPTLTIASSSPSVAGGATQTDTMTDSAHVLDTGWWVKGVFGGTDSGWCPTHQNESVQWEQIGWPGRPNFSCSGTCTPPGLAATLNLNPATATQSTGGSQMLTATLLGGDSVPLANAPVTISVTGGPDKSTPATTGYTDSNGNVTMNLTNGGTAGADTLVASAGFIGPFYSNTACVVFGSGTCGSPPPPNDFSINASPNSVSVAPGSGTSTSINTAITSGSAQSVMLSASGLPSGANATFTNSTITSGGSTTMNFTTTTSTPTGSFPITVTGTGTSATHSTTVTLNVTSSPPPPPGCPMGWTCSDIGSPTPAGSESVSSGSWSIMAGGSDIFSIADHFRFDYQSPGGTNNTIEAHITGQSNSNAWAKAGVMMRADTTAGSAQFSVLITPGNGVFVEYRSASGATTTRAGTVAGILPPQYIRIVRTGTTFVGSYSTDNTTWHTLFTQTVAAMSGTVLEGLAAASHNSSALCTVTMDTVTIS
ncbi:MAG: hypothetical protein JOZ46_01680 [Candidatus Dormibacteraeota bacterium]|nr:hypothetical protein [Candidatus Dormibacteraeota bacterium]MBV9524506.1 hypothetical protein [Candidatus Dormibacteraeota bacterium]